MVHAPRSRTPLLVAFIAVCLFGLILLNVAQQRMDPAYQQQMAEERAQKEAETQQQSQTRAPAAPSASPNDLVLRGQAATLGNPQSPRELIVRWEWTPQIQAQPAAFLSDIEMMANMARGQIKIDLINVDDQPGAETGVFLKNKKIAELTPQGMLDKNVMSNAMSQIMGSSSAPP